LKNCPLIAVYQDNSGKTIMPKDQSGIEKQRRKRGANIKTASYDGPQKSGRKRGSIEIGKYNTENWTVKNYVVTVLLLAIPYGATLIALYSSGLKFLAGILLGVTLLCALLVALAYWVDKADF
jgi:hypothetical protein